MWPGKGVAAVARKALVNQATMAPFNSALFLTWSTALEPPVLTRWHGWDGLTKNECGTQPINHHQFLPILDEFPLSTEDARKLIFEKAVTCNHLQPLEWLQDSNRPQVAASGRKSLPLPSKSSRSFASDRKCPQVTAGDPKWPQVTAWSRTMFHILEPTQTHERAPQFLDRNEAQTLKGEGVTWNERGRTWHKKGKTWNEGRDFKTKGCVENERRSTPTSCKELTLRRKEVILNETKKRKGVTWNSRGRTWTKKGKAWNEGGLSKTSQHKRTFWKLKGKEHTLKRKEKRDDLKRIREVGTTRGDLKRKRQDLI